MFFLIINMRDFYRALDKRFKKEYAKEFGKDAFNYEWRLYTKDQQVERYGKNMKFWYERMPKKKALWGQASPLSDNKYLIAKYCMCSQNYCRLYKIAEDMGILNDVIEYVNKKNTSSEVPYEYVKPEPEVTLQDMALPILAV